MPNLQLPANLVAVKPPGTNLYSALKTNTRFRTLVVTRLTRPLPSNLCSFSGKAAVHRFVQGTLSKMGWALPFLDCREIASCI